MFGVRVPCQIHGGLGRHQPQRRRATGWNLDSNQAQGGATERDGRPQHEPRSPSGSFVGGRFGVRRRSARQLDTQQGPGKGQYEGQADVYVAFWQGRRSVCQL